MLNIIDIVVGLLVILYLVKNLGGPAKIIKSLVIVILVMMIFGVIVRLLVDAPLPDSAKKTINDSYFVQLSHLMIRWVYPAVETGAPRVNSFIKDRILFQPTPEVTLPAVSVTLPANMLPTISLPTQIKD